MWSAILFNLDQSKNVSSGNGLTFMFLLVFISIRLGLQGFPFHFELKQGSTITTTLTTILNQCRVFPQLSVERVTMTPFICIKDGRIINFGGHLEKFGGQNPQNNKKKGVMENPANVIHFHKFRLVNLFCHVCFHRRRYFYEN